MTRFPLAAWDPTPVNFDRGDVTRAVAASCENEVVRALFAQPRTVPTPALTGGEMSNHTCSIAGCDQPHLARGWCGTHYARWKRHGDPLTTMPMGRPGGTPSGSENPFWGGDDIGYTGVHERLRRSRGPARQHRCACGATAAHWAYDHNDPDQLFDDRGCPYSPRIEHYVPMCQSCHQKQDRRRAS